jgi:hypothetical protein
MEFRIAVITAATVMAGAWTASATITVNSGSIYTVDPGATSYGALRFKDFTNTKDGGDTGNLYLANTGGQLGSNPNSDGRWRVQASPHWVAGTSHPFSFEYRPVAGATDLILAQAANMTTSAQRVIDDPTASVNFISFWIHNTPLNDVVTPDTIALHLTDLDGNTLTPSDLIVGYPGGDFNWYLTDPTLLANGFILTGSVNLTTGVDAGEGDKIDIAFGSSLAAVPEPTTMIAGALLLLPFGVSTLRMLRKSRRA